MSSAMFGGAADDSITGLMKAYNNFTLGENVAANNQAFGRAGIPQSTGHTYANVGAEANKVYQEVRESDAMRAANQAEATAQAGTLGAGIGAAGSLAGGLKGGI